MPTALRVLILEDNPSDAELMLHALRRDGYDPVGECVETEQDYRDQLRSSPEVILSDYSMPEFDAMRALVILQECRFDIPFILVSGSVGEERAVQVMQQGATDYVVKDRIGRLGQAVAHALEKRLLLNETRMAERRVRAQHAVTHALAESPSLATAGAKILHAVCDNLGWDFGALWQFDASRKVLYCVDCWSNPTAAVAEFEAFNRHSTFPPDVGFLGRIWETKQPVWVADFASDLNFPRAPFAARAGLHAAFGIPIILGAETLGILEFMHREIKQPDAEKLTVMMAIGSQLGQYIERKRTEASLRQSESLVRELTAHVHQVLWVMDAKESKIAYVSKGYEQLWGRTCQSLLDNPHTYAEGIHSDDLDVWRRADALMYQTGHIDTEFRVLRPDGSVRWVWARGYPVKVEDQIVRIVGVVEDVTDKKLLAAERDALLARLQLQIERMPLAYLLGGPDMRYTRWNPTAERMFGFAEAEVLGKHPCETIVPAKSTDLVAGLFARLAAGDMDAHVVCENVTKDGRTITCEWHNTPVFDANGTFQGVLSLAQDITARKQVEVTLGLRDRAIRAVTQGILITDPSQPDNPVIYASPGVLQMTGYSAAEIVGRNCRFLQGEGTDAAAVARMREAIQEQVPCTVEVLNYRKDGTPFWNELSISPVQDAAGRLTHFVGVLADVTGRRNLEEQLRQSQKMEAVGQLAGGVAHDFNNLLTIINGYSQMIHDEVPAGSPWGEFSHEISQAGKRAAALTQQLLAFSRKQVLEPKVLSLNGIVTDTERMLQRLIGEDISVSAVLHPDLGHVKADPGQIEQVLLNLAVNARDAMPQGGKLTIETTNTHLDVSYTQAHPDLRPGPYVLLAMTDTGTGMDPATKARIFEPFFTTKQPGSGTGLGLSTVFGIVKQSGGHLSVYTELGRGTTFKVYLPRVESAPGSGVAVVRKPKPAPGTATILLTEDEPALRALARRVLAGHGTRSWRRPAVRKRSPSPPSSVTRSTCW